jgi:uncharacterized protein (DUF1501 family)
METYGRRQFIKSGALALGATLVTSRVAFARADSGTKSRFVFVILRGALDGLAAVPPYGDPPRRPTAGQPPRHRDKSGGGSGRKSDDREVRVVVGHQ